MITTNTILQKHVYIKFQRQVSILLPISYSTYIPVPCLTIMSPVLQLCRNKQHKQMSKIMLSLLAKTPLKTYALQLHLNLHSSCSNPSAPCIPCSCLDKLATQFFISFSLKQYREIDRNSLPQIPFDASSLTRCTQLTQPHYPWHHLPSLSTYPLSAEILELSA